MEQWDRGVVEKVILSSAKNLSCRWCDSNAKGLKDPSLRSG